MPFMRTRIRLQVYHSSRTQTKLPLLKATGERGMSSQLTSQQQPLVPLNYNPLGVESSNAAPTSQQHVNYNPLGGVVNPQDVEAALHSYGQLDFGDLEGMLASPDINGNRLEDAMHPQFGQP